jgi:DNA polymerase-3 subunit delta
LTVASQREKSISFEELVGSFEQKRFAPLYLFHGEEGFLIEEALDALLDNAIDPTSRSLNLDVLYGSELDVQDVVARASSFPMIGERRVVIVREAEKLTSSEAKRAVLLRYLEQPSPATCLVFTAAKVDFRLAVYKSFQTKGVVAEFRPLFEDRVPAWVAQRLRRTRKEITPEAVDLLQSHVGNSLRDLNNEIEKLIIYVGDRNLVEVDDVRAVVGMSKTYNIFELQKAIGSGDLSRSLEIVDRMLDAGEVATVMIAGLVRYFRKLWVLPSLRKKAKTEYELASALDVRPYFLKEYASAAARLSPTQIESALAALLEADESLKSTGADPRLIMTVAIHRLVGPSPDP